MAAIEGEAFSVACSLNSFLRRLRRTGPDELIATAFAGCCGKADSGIGVNFLIALVYEVAWAPKSLLDRPGTTRSNAASFAFQLIALDCC